MITLLNIELAALEKSIDILNKDSVSKEYYDNFENLLSMFDLFLSLKKLYKSTNELKSFFRPIVNSEKTRIYSGWDKTPIIKFNETRSSFRDNLSGFFNDLFYLDKYLYHMFTKHKFDYSYGNITFKSDYFENNSDEILIENSIAFNENKADFTYICKVLQRKYNYVKNLYYIEKGFSEPDDRMMFHEDDILHNQKDLLKTKKHIINLDDVDRIMQLNNDIDELENCIMNTLKKLSHYLRKKQILDKITRLD